MTPNQDQVSRRCGERLSFLSLPRSLMLALQLKRRGERISICGRFTRHHIKLGRLFSHTNVPSVSLPVRRVVRCARRVPCEQLHHHAAAAATPPVLLQQELP